VVASKTTAASPAQRVYRARRISTTFGRIYLGAKAHRFIARRLQPADMDERWSRFHRTSAESVYEAAIELRGLILKGCQFLGSRADVLPREWVQVLSKLQDRVPPRTFSVARRTVERELGAELSEIFDDFSKRPIASASLAQVHRARLKNGQAVAVKIQYPEIERLIRSDLSNLRFLFKAVEWMERDFDLMPLIDELGTHVPRELDFLNEGHNAETIARFLEGRGDVVVPRVHWEHTTRRVLVMDLMEGIKITDVSRLEKAGVDRNRVVQTLVEVYCEQVLSQGFFHADPHPGNLLVQPTKSGPRLVMLDFGLAKKLPPGFRKGVVSFASAMLKGDGDIMAEALIELGFETRDGDPESLSEIAHYLLKMATEFQKRAYLERDMKARISRELPEKIRENPIVRIPSHVVLLGRVLGLLSGVSRSLGSRVDLVRTILPYAFERPRPGN
jgi:aarF domain-containing kinase